MQTIQHKEHEAKGAASLATGSSEAGVQSTSTRRFFDLSSILSRRRSRVRVTEPGGRFDEPKLRRWREPATGGAA